MKGIRLTTLPGAYALCRLAADAQIPAWARLDGMAELALIARTSDELSILLLQERVPDSLECEGDLRAIKVIGPLPLDTVGVLAGLAQPLAAEGIPILAVSTHDTDYILVKAARLGPALDALARAGYEVLSTEPPLGAGFAAQQPAAAILAGVRKAQGAPPAGMRENGPSVA
jgi:hypothetical protein